MKILLSLIVSLTLVGKLLCSRSCAGDGGDVADLHLAPPNALPGCKNNHQIEDRASVCRYCQEPRLTMEYAVLRLCDAKAAPPARELKTLLKFVKISSQFLSTAASAVLMRDLVECGLVNRIIENYGPYEFEKVAALQVLPWPVIFQPFEPFLESMNPSHLMYESYRSACKALVESMTGRYHRSFSIDAVNLSLRMDPYRSLLRQVLFGLLHLRNFEYHDLVHLLTDDPFWELAHARMFEVLFLALKRYGRPPASKVFSSRYGPENVTLKEFCSLNHALAALI